MPVKKIQKKIQKNTKKNNLKINKKIIKTAKIKLPPKKNKAVEKIVTKNVKKKLPDKKPDKKPYKKPDKKLDKKPSKKAKKIVTKIVKKISTQKPKAKSANPKNKDSVNKKIISKKNTNAKIVKKHSVEKPAKKTIKHEVKSKAAANTQLSKAKKSSKTHDAEIAVRQNNKTKSVVAKSSDKDSFRVGDYAVYPPHGVGKISAIEKMIVLGQEFKCYLMHFEREKLAIKIPVSQAEKSGLRSLASKSQIDKVFSILRSGVKKLKGMWSRRAQEYEAKINSGDIILLAEVLRDLARDIEDGERSYSERIIYETAIYRLAMEYSFVYMVDFEVAKQKVIATAKDKIGSFDQKEEKEFDLFKKDEDLDLEEEVENEDEEEIDDLEEGDDETEYEEDEDDDFDK
jgi:CarD family transcriptional regulator